MIIVILAGGYAKRLWPLTLNRPKVLLPVAGKPVIDYLVEKVLRVKPAVSRILVSTNLLFDQQFREWLTSRKYGNVELVPDNSRSQDEKIGAVKALANIASKIEEDFLVLAGDSLFPDELDGFVRFFEEKRAPVVALYRVKSLEEAKRGSSVDVEADGRIVEFVEKPSDPRTTLVGACVYAFPASIKTRLKEYSELGLGRDEPGRFIEWLHRVEPIYGYMLKDYLIDIGTMEAYESAEGLLNKSMRP